MAKQRTHVARPVESAVYSAESPAVLAANSQDIAALAYQLWEARGCPYGSPDVDWFEAEQQLQGRARQAPDRQQAVSLRRAGA